MLYEGDVIEAVCNKLQSEGFEITQALDTNQKGDDIIAVRNRGIIRDVYIEAKGETSSSHTKRFGRPFDRSQVHDHIAMALFKAVTVLAQNVGISSVGAGIALPDTRNHRDIFNQIRPIVKKLGITVFWVSEDRSVTVDGLWK